MSRVLEYASRLDWPAWLAWAGVVLFLFPGLMLELTP